MKLNDKFKALESALVYKVWGGKQMSSLKSVAALSKNKEPLGETWEISIHPDGPSLIDGEPLADHISKNKMPYMVKLIDTGDNLSVQVHPDDEFAKEFENSLGKTECWIILGAEDGAGIYLGMKPGVDKASFKKALSSGGKMNEFLVFHPVKRGDFFYVPAGTIHAIGCGVFLAEVQQSSGITYRVWDWNRVDHKGYSRELHVDKAMQVICFGDDFNCPKTFKQKTGIFTQGISQLINHPQFNLRQVTLKKDEKLDIELSDYGRAIGILNLDGSILINDLNLQDYQSAVSNGTMRLTIIAKEDGSFLLVE